MIQARRQQLTAEALTQAQEALIGYAVRYREEQLKTGTPGWSMAICRCRTSAARATIIS